MHPVTNPLYNATPFLAMISVTIRLALDDSPDTSMRTVALVSSHFLVSQVRSNVLHVSKADWPLCPGPLRTKICRMCLRSAHVHLSMYRPLPAGAQSMLVACVHG